MTSRLWHVITWPLLVGVAACNSGELSRSQAAKALAARIDGPVGSIRVLRARCVEKYFEKYPIRFIEDDRGPTVRAVASGRHAPLIAQADRIEKSWGTTSACGEGWARTSA